MLRKTLFYLFLLTALLQVHTGCTSLREVSDYSVSAAKSLRTFEDMAYSFTKSCRERCMLEQLESGRLSASDCPCELEQQADSVMLMLYSATKGYFDGLARLSANNLTNYTFDALKKSLTAGNFGGVQISQNQVQSYAKLSGVLTKALTDGYRKKKLATYIGESNDAIITLLQALQFTLENNLTGRLDTKKSRLRSYYFDLATDAKTTVYERKKIIEEYTSLVAGIEETKKQIRTYARALSLVADGHQQLFDNRAKLTVPRLRESLTLYASNLQDIMAEFNKLKNQN
jgi:hypothetical protein